MDCRRSARRSVDVSRCVFRRSGVDMNALTAGVAPWEWLRTIDLTVDCRRSTNRSYQGIKRPLAGQGPEPQKSVNAPLSGGHAFFVRRHAAQFRDNESFQLETALRPAVLCLTRTICCHRGAFLFALAIIKARDSFSFHSSLTAVLKQLEVVWSYISRVRLLD